MGSRQLFLPVSCYVLTWNDLNRMNKTTCIELFIQDSKNYKSQNQASFLEI